MKKPIILLIFVALAALVSAQYYSSISNTSDEVIQQSTSTMSTGFYTIPTSTIYEPFSDETPSSIGSARKAPGGPGITGDDQDYSDPTINPNPIGNAVPFLLFLAAGYAFLARRKKA